jgi:hypothetical protein
VRGGERIEHPHREERGGIEILNKDTILHPKDSYNNGGRFGRTPNPKTLHKTLINQEEKKKKKP